MYSAALPMFLIWRKNLLSYDKMWVFFFARSEGQRMWFFKKKIFTNFFCLTKLENNLFNCVRGRRTQHLVCVGCSVQYWVSCVINKGGFLRLHFRRRHIFASLWGAGLRFAWLWRASPRGDSCVLVVHLSMVCWGLIFCLRKAFVF